MNHWTLSYYLKRCNVKVNKVSIYVSDVLGKFPSPIWGSKVCIWSQILIKQQKSNAETKMKAKLLQTNANLYTVQTDNLMF